MENIFGENENLCNLAVKAWKDGITKNISYVYLVTKTAKGENKIKIGSYADKIRKYDASFKAPTVSTGACYVATAVYGSYDCPQVWVLRRYRDNVLAETWYGRAFIRTYYTVSPTLVRWFGDKAWFQNLFKHKLDVMVEELQYNGVENTPYSDENWSI